MSSVENKTRRSFFKKLAALPISIGANPFALQLLGIANAAAQAADDYKALVCVFLFGGNDHYNTVVPYDIDNYSDYYAVRGTGSATNGVYDGIAINRNSLINTVLTSDGLPSGVEMALAPSMTGMHSLFKSGKLKILLNSGTLLVPTTLSQFNNGSVPLPGGLFAHNLQAKCWHTGGMPQSVNTGWGGRMADFFLQDNTNVASLTCLSMSGSSIYLTGGSASAFAIDSSKGLFTVNAIKNNSLEGSSVCSAALRQLITQNSNHWMEEEHAKIARSALNNYEVVSSAIGTSPSASLASKMPSSASNALSKQLLMVARLIEKHRIIGLKRQVFFVGIGGFDLHGGLTAQHSRLLKVLSDGLFEFNSALEYMGMDRQVTAFTASDFGRTLTSNGSGSDHGWGGHQFIMGGAVDGGKFCGVPPPIGASHNQQVGSGRLIPSTSLDQMAAELARWFGVSNSDIPSVLPNSRYFDLHRLGIFRKIS